MIAILGRVNFENNEDTSINSELFFSSGYYKRQNYVSHGYRTKVSTVFTLQKSISQTHVFVGDDVQLFIFGTVFKREKVEKSVTTPTGIMSAFDIWKLYQQCGDGITSYIKGSFSIILIDEQAECVKLMSDRMNLAPLYYFYKNGEFVFSSSLNLLLEHGFVPRKVNTKALAEFGIFGYVLGNGTFIKDVFMQSYASIITVTSDRIDTRKYWDIQSILTSCGSRLKRNEAFGQCNKLLKNIVNTYVSDQNYFALTLTGGYDSRTLLAVLNRNKDDFFCYSYGLEKCFDIQLPQEISKAYQLDFKAFILGRDFESNFDENAVRSVYYSDGLGSITKANVLYPCEKIANSVDVILSGLFGSEMIKQPTSTGYYVNAEVKRMLLSNSPHEHFKRLVDFVKFKNYLKSHILDENEAQIFEELHDAYLSTSSSNYNFWRFVALEGIRKYFMQEIKIERPHVENRHPFLDDDFVDLLYKTPFAGIYNFAGKKNVLKAATPHQLYAYIICKNKPLLGRYMTTHGYRPVDILSFCTRARAVVDYLRYKGAARDVQTYDYLRWVHNFCGEHYEILKYKSMLFTGETEKKYMANEHLESIEEFSKYLSLRLWAYLHNL